MANAGIAALGAVHRRAGGVAAKVAGHPLLRPVQGEGETAVGTAADVPAGLAEDRRGVTPTVEEENDLLSEFETPGDGHLERGGEPAVRAGTLPLKLEVDDADQRHLLTVGAAGKFQEAVFSREGVAVAFHGGGCAPEDNGASLEASPHHGHIPRMVPGTLLLLVGSLMLLVDDENAEVTEGGEDRAPRPDHDPCLPPSDPEPFLPSLSLTQMTVKDGDPVTRTVEP